MNGQLKNPYQTLYWNPHLHAQKFAKMTTKYHQERDLEILKRIADLTGRKILDSSDVHWRQRIKFKEWGFQIGLKKVYLLPN